MAYSRLRGSSQGQYSPLPFNGQGGYGVQGRSITALMPPADVLPLRRRETSDAEAAPVLEPSREEQLLDRLVRRLQDIGVYNPRNYVTLSTTFLQIAGFEGDKIALDRPTTLRQYLFIQNTDIGGDTVWIDFDKQAIPGRSTPIFPDGGFFEWITVIPQNVIWARAAGAESGQLTILFAEMPPKGRLRDRG